MARVVSGTFDQIGRAVQKPFSVAEFGIKGIESQLARSQRSLENAIAHGLDPKQADALREELASLTSEAQKQLSNLRIKINTADLDNFQASLDDGVSAMHQSMAQLVKDLRVAGSGSATIKALGGIETVLATAMERREQITQELSAAQATLNGLMDQYRQRVDQVTAAFTQFASVTAVQGTDSWGAAVSAEGLINQLQDRVNAASQFTDDVAKMRRAGLNETTLQQIIDAGPGQAAAQASVLASATASELQKINALTAQVTSAGARTGNLSANMMYQTGINAARAVVDGLLAEQQAVQDTISNLAGQAEILVAADMANQGAAAAKAVADGLLTQQPALQDTLETLKGTAQILHVSDMVNQGAAAVDGIITGINSRKAALAAAMTSLGSTVVSSLQSVLDIHSPSRVTAREVGVPVVDGVIEGMKSRNRALAAAAADMRGNLLGGGGLAVSHAPDARNANNRTVVEVVLKGGDDLTERLAQVADVRIYEREATVQDLQRRSSTVAIR